MKIIISAVIIVTFAIQLLVGFPEMALAEEGHDSESKEEVRLGTLAGTGGGSTGFAGNSGLEEKANPLGGSLNKVANNRWQMKVFNNSDDTYRASFQVKLVDAKGNKISTRGFSYTLKGHETKEDVINTDSRTANCILNLSSAKNLTPKKPKEENTQKENS